MGVKQAYEKEVRTQLERLDAQLDEIAAKANRVTGRAKLQYGEELDELRELRYKVWGKFGELEDAGEAAWQGLKSELDEAVGHLQDGVDKALSA